MNQSLSKTWIFLAFTFSVSLATAGVSTPNISKLTKTNGSVEIRWTNKNGIPRGGFDILIDGKDTGTKHRTKKLITKFKTSGKCFRVEGRYTDKKVYPRSTQKCLANKTSNSSPTPIISKVEKSGGKVNLSWSLSGAVPKGGFDIIIDGKDTGTKHRTKNTSLKLSTSGKCFRIEARFTDKKAYPRSAEKCVKTTVQTPSKKPKKIEVGKITYVAYKKGSKPYHGYAQYIPKNYHTSGKSYPLILFIHGMGERGNGGIESLKSKMTKHGPLKLVKNGQWRPSQDMIIIAPQSSGGWFNTERTNMVLDDALSRLRIDKKRIYYTGLSAGAINGFTYIAQASNRIAAAVLIAGHGNNAFRSHGCKMSKVPLWVFHGQGDTTIGYMGSVGAVDKINNDCRPNPAARITIYDKSVGHDSWTRTYDGSGHNKTLSRLKRHDRPTDRLTPFKKGDNVFEWLLKHRK